MPALVMDTSIVIDLERAGLLDAAFSYGWVVLVPDLLYEKELAENGGPYLRSLGLGVVELAPEEVEVAQQMKAARRTLSLADCFAAACAMREESILLCGDANLRAESEARGVEVHGLLWLLDQMEAHGAAVSQLFEGLQRVANHRNCRLPKNEVADRMKRWDQTDGLR